MITHGIYKPIAANTMIAISTEELGLIVKRGESFYPIWINNCINSKILILYPESFSYFNNIEWNYIFYSFKGVLIYKKKNLSIMTETAFNANYEEIV